MSSLCVCCGVEITHALYSLSLFPPPQPSPSHTPESRPQSSSSEDHSYVPTVTPTSSTPQTPSEGHPPPQLPIVESPPPMHPEEPTNEYILELYREGVPFIRYKDLKIVGKLGQVSMRVHIILWRCKYEPESCSHMYTNF